MQLIVAFCADGPDNRIRRAIRGRQNGRSTATERRAPRKAHRGRAARSDIEHCDVSARTMAAARTRKRDHGRRVCLVHGRSSANGATCDRQHLNGAPDTAEIVPVHQIRVAVLAEGDDSFRRFASRHGNIDRQRFGATEILIAVVERLPVRRCEIVLAVIRMGETGLKLDDGFAVAPYRRRRVRLAPRCRHRSRAFAT